MSEQNIKITLPDGSVKEYDKGISSHEIAMSISEGLARNVLAANVNNEIWDCRIFDSSGFFGYIPFRDETNERISAKSCR